jgi:biopolymer transport protein ExbB
MLIDIINKGGYVMYPLIACSVIALAVILERLFFWFGIAKNRDADSINTILSHAEKGDFDQAKQVCEHSTDYLAKVLLCGIVHREFSLSDALEMGAKETIRRMNKYLGILDTIITLSPLLGNRDSRYCSGSDNNCNRIGSRNNGPYPVQLLYVKNRRGAGACRKIRYRP